MNGFKKFYKVYGKILTALDAFTAGMVFMLMLLITADVVARTAFHHPFQGVAEIVSNCIIILCLLEIPYVLRKGSHVRSTMLYDKLGQRGKCVIDIIASVLGLIVYIFIIRSSWAGFIKALTTNDSEIAGSVRIPTSPGRFSIIMGSALMCLEFILQGIKNAICLKTPDAFDDMKGVALPEGGEE